MSTCVLDTSVAVAWYLQESFSLSARRWQERLISGRVHLLVPSLHFWEFGNVLRTYVKRDELNTDLAEEIYALHCEAPLDIVEPARDNVLRMAIEYRATVYDGVYICLALEQDLPLVTAERTTTPWVVKLGDRVESVR